MTLTYAFAPIFKRETTDDGHLILHGKATGPDLDLDQQICDPEWLKGAMPQWFATGANVREMHQAKAVGKGVELEATGDDWMLTSKIVDKDAIVKCDEDIYTGYSIGIKGARVVKDASAPNGRIVGGSIIEVSIVDRPANPTAKLVAAKAAGSGEVVLLDESDEDVAKRDYSDDERASMADSGEAMPSGGFPIKNTADLKHAIEAIGRAKNPTAAKAHIKARAEALGQSDLIPDSWKAATPDGSDDEFTHDPTELAQVRESLVHLIQAELDELVDGEPELWDVSALLEALTLFLNWWEKEAWEGETTSPDADDEPADPTVVTLAADADGTITLGADADTTVVVDTLEKAAEPDEPTTKTVTLDSGEVERITADAVTKATQPLEAALDVLRGQLAEVMKMAAPGGPNRTRSPRQATATARLESLQADQVHFRRLATTVTDPQLQQGYRDRVKAIEAEINALTTL